MGFLNRLKVFLSSSNKEIDIHPKTEIENLPLKYEDKNKKEYKGNTVIVETIDINPNVYLVNKATRLCIGKGELDTYENRLAHIQKCTKRGHESVLEHSNIVAMIRIDKSYIADVGIGLVVELIDMLSKCHYLHFSEAEADNSINILIGGSIRGFIHLLREWVTSPSVEVDIYYAMKTMVCESIEKEFLVELIENGIVDEEDCIYVANTELGYETYVNDKGEVDQEVVAKPFKDPKVLQFRSCPNVDLIYPQDVMKVYNKVKSYGFIFNDVYEVCTVTFLFHDISRAIGNQLVRHRVGITQESQRYCEHNTDRIKDFVDPIRLHQSHKTGRYDNLDERIETEYLRKRNPFTVYKYLISQGIYKEDARAWLPMNVTTKIIMTFTYKQFAKFYELRSADGAQFEIRLLADQCRTYICNLENCSMFGYGAMFDTYINDALLPRAYRSTSTNEKVLKGLDSIEEEYQKYFDQVVQKVEIDETDNNISTEVEEVETRTTPEDIKSLDINSVEDAEKYLKMNEDMKKL